MEKKVYKLFDSFLQTYCVEAWKEVKYQVALALKTMLEAKIIIKRRIWFLHHIKKDNSFKI